MNQSSYVLKCVTLSACLVACSASSSADVTPDAGSTAPVLPGPASDAGATSEDGGARDGGARCDSQSPFGPVEVLTEFAVVKAPHSASLSDNELTLALIYDTPAESFVAVADRPTREKPFGTPKIVYGISAWKANAFFTGGQVGLRGDGLLLLFNGSSLNRVERPSVDVPFSREAVEYLYDIDDKQPVKDVGHPKAVASSIYSMAAIAIQGAGYGYQVRESETKGGSSSTSTIYSSSDFLRGFAVSADERTLYVTADSGVTTRLSRASKTDSFAKPVVVPAADGEDFSVTWVSVDDCVIYGDRGSERARQLARRVRGGK